MMSRRTSASAASASTAARPSITTTRSASTAGSTPSRRPCSASNSRTATYTRLIEEAGLAEFITPPFILEGARHIFHQYVVRVPEARRDALLEHLNQNSVGTKVYYPVPLHLQPCFADLGYKQGDFPE